jgi:hypothetical protein
MFSHSSDTRATRPRRAAASRIRLLGVALGAAIGWTALSSTASAEPVVVSGRVEGGDTLLNPVWNAAKDPKSRRFTFRMPSLTVNAKAKVLTAYLPKELCIAVLADAGAASKVPIRMTVSGGRTTPVTVVVPEGQEIQIENHDPFPHRIYGVDKIPQPLQPSDIEPTKSRRWTPPGPGKYELRDERAPSVRSWIVVVPKVVKTTYPTVKNEFQVELEPGAYTLQGYFNGEPVGKPLPVNVQGLPKQQKIPTALTVGEAPKADAKKADDKKGG